MEDKVLWKSKTLWVSLILAIAAFFPVVRDFVAANPVVFEVVVAGVFAVLRFVSKGKILIA